MGIRRAGPTPLVGAAMTSKRPARGTQRRAVVRASHRSAPRSFWMRAHGPFGESHGPVHPVHPCCGGGEPVRCRQKLAGASPGQSRSRPRRSRRRSTPWPLSPTVVRLGDRRVAGQFDDYHATAVDSGARASTAAQPLVKDSLDDVKDSWAMLRRDAAATECGPTPNPDGGDHMDASFVLEAIVVLGCHPHGHARRRRGRRAVGRRRRRHPGLRLPRAARCSAGGRGRDHPRRRDRGVADASRRRDRLDGEGRGRDHRESTEADHPASPRSPRSSSRSARAPATSSIR